MTTRRSRGTNALLLVIVGAFACSSETSESRRRNVEEREADQARTEAEVSAMAQFLKNLPMACPTQGSCFLSSSERQNLVALTAMRVRAVGGLWGSLVTQNPIRARLVAKPEGLEGAIDSLFVGAPETGHFWEETVTPARRTMKKAARTQGVETFLGRPTSLGPEIPVQEIMAKAVTLDDEQLTKFSTE